MIRLYREGPLSKGKELVLEGVTHYYLYHVMRLREKDELLLFNGKEGEWKARVLKSSKKGMCLVLEVLVRPQEEEGDLWLLFSPLKPKRQEFLVEKATELGVSCLFPVQCDHTSMGKVNLEKMKAHAVEAAEQCGRLTIPGLNPLVSLSSLLKEWPSERCLLFGDETLDSALIRSLPLDPSRKYAFLVGPEGGFSEAELRLLRHHPQGQGVTLSSQILRAETAALVGVSYLRLQLMERDLY